MKPSQLLMYSRLSVSLALIPLLAGCASREIPHQLGQVPPVYDTAEQIRVMPACEAVVVERGPCYVQLKTADGNAFLIGSPGAGDDILQFLEVLKEGQTYKFPQTFRNYQKQRQSAGKGT